MFKLVVPESNANCSTLQKSIGYDADLRMAAHEQLKKHLRTDVNVNKPTITANHTEGDVNDTIFYAADKFVQYIQSRETCVTFHGPNDCSDKKPWAQYTHFHVTVISDRRLGTDSRYNNVVALHRKCATSHIPASQQTRFPASWANYLCQEPRILWHADTHQLISEFAGWTMAEYHNKQEQLPANRKRTFQDMETKTTDDTNPENATLTMRNGKVQKLYDYLSWMIREYGYSTREDLVNGALSHGTSDNFSRALIHPHFDTILTKAFCMDRAVEINTPFKVLFEKMDWSKFQTDQYLSKEVSLHLINQILEAQDINLGQFANDVYDLLTFQKPKQNLICLEGVPNSGKS